MPGALFSIGDGHYTMGEGEVCGVAVEGAMDTLLTVDLIKGVYCDWPRLEDDESIMVAGSYRPLGGRLPDRPHPVDPVDRRDQRLVADGHLPVGHPGSRSPIANVVDANYTIVAKMPKGYLPADIEWMGGMHGRLRGIGHAVRPPGGSPFA